MKKTIQNRLITFLASDPKGHISFFHHFVSVYLSVRRKLFHKCSLNSSLRNVN